MLCKWYGLRSYLEGLLYFNCFELSYLFIYYLFIYFWLCWVFVAAHRLSLVAVHRHLRAMACLCCGAQALGMQTSVVVAQGGSVVVARRL